MQSPLASYINKVNYAKKHGSSTKKTSLIAPRLRKMHRPGHRNDQGTAMTRAVLLTIRHEAQVSVDGLKDNTPELKGELP